MHLKRVLTGIIAFPILVFVIGFAPRWLFYFLIYIISILGLNEYYNVTSSDQPKFVKWSSYIITLLLFLVIYMRQILLAPVVVILWAFVPMVFFMFTRPSPDQKNTAEISKAVLGQIYIALPLAMFLYIDRFYPVNGAMWIFFLLTVIFANDTGAFYFGKLFGRHKLYPLISPNKTWEGSIGGLLTSFFAAFVFLRIIIIHPVNIKIFLLVLSLSVIGQIGDLLESMLKRNHGIKDSGNIIPGHGGILDRLDSILFSIPVLYVYLFIFVTC